jgi:four helix bundle protein
MFVEAVPKQSVRINSAKDLRVYRAAYELAMKAFVISKKFPPEERYALTSQIRRSSRSVCLNLREAWAKRRYEANFVSKLTDCDGENSETDSSLDFARDCGYITLEQHATLARLCEEIGKMLGSMIKHPRSFVMTC